MGKIFGESFGSKLENSLAGVKIEIIQKPDPENKNIELLKLDIVDRDAWESPAQLEKLCNIFGESVLQAFGPRNKNVRFDMKDKTNRDEAIENIKEGDFGDSDSIYLTVKNGKLAGFLTGKNIDVPGNKKGFLVNLVFTKFKNRNQGVCEDLYRQMFLRGNYDAVVSCSTTPGAVKKQLNVGRENGYNGFYCGYKNENLNDRGTSREQAMIEKISRALLKDYADCGVTPPLKDMPADHLVILQEAGPIPPPEEGDYNFEDGDQLGEIFKKVVLPTQKKYLPNTIYSLVICLKRE
ncbi:MAG: hypothetical protein NTZ49_04290 [Candidatus Parcubacteria bacterium]|nr:hypothetical protein [Candidatus Parcubacteria bacterium]